MRLHRAPIRHASTNSPKLNHVTYDVTQSLRHWPIVTSLTNHRSINDVTDQSLFNHYLINQSLSNHCRRRIVNGRCTMLHICVRFHMHNKSVTLTCEVRVVQKACSAIKIIDQSHTTRDVHWSIITSLVNHYVIDQSHACTMLSWECSRRKLGLFKKSVRG